LGSALQEAGVDDQTADAVLEDYGSARVDGLRTALALLAIFAVIALFFTRRVPDQQPVSAETIHGSSAG
ncbi:MAG TPA: MFS transporter, partial [Actinomycetota bacterium]|nr:MFS transporter [Actinomycetota bacterium]